jgi:hypothetical protein
MLGTLYPIEHSRSLSNPYLEVQARAGRARAITQYREWYVLLFTTRVINQLESEILKSCCKKVSFFVVYQAVLYILWLNYHLCCYTD